ncbi:helix-turn-helix domain-containing protein [Sanguibacter sp. 25GB23B1]|uniref:helix-turn-helix domain-containing protein n=1 Tax=unclassified Sanguibacter TaxID=2645534 RepID=UPI0032AF7D71
MSVDLLADLVRRATAEPPLEGLRATAEVRREMDRLEVVLVHRARNSGSTWTQIAEALGVSKQAVHRKHGGRSLFGSEQ